tara:strand:- start:416 stop:892 length:477 start_codon:yes stop_codon:yes gene_type:complete
VSLTIKEIDYENSKDLSKLESALKNWFSNPKDLNFADPNTQYPFDMKKWTRVNHKLNKIKTLAALKNEWIVGFIGIKVFEDLSLAHITQIYVDDEHKGKGYKEILIKNVEKKIFKQNIDRLTITSMKKDDSAQLLYKKLSFKEVGVSGNKINFEKKLT